MKEIIAFIRVVGERKPSFNCGNQYREALNAICNAGIDHAKDLNAEIMNLVLGITKLPPRLEEAVMQWLPNARQSFDRYLNSWSQNEDGSEGASILNSNLEILDHKNRGFRPSRQSHVFEPCGIISKACPVNIMKAELNFEDGTSPLESKKRFPILERKEIIALIRVVGERKPSFNCGNQYREALNVICNAGIGHPRETLNKGAICPRFFSD